MHAPPAHLHPIITIGPFAKWGIDFMMRNPHLARGHAYITVVIDYFTKWAKTMTTLVADGKIAAQFIFNHIISRFGVPQEIVIDHGSHFLHYMVVDLTSKLGLCHDISMTYYPRANGQVEAVNKVLIC